MKYVITWWERPQNLDVIDAVVAVVEAIKWRDSRQPPATSSGSD